MNDEEILDRIAQAYEKTGLEPMEGGFINYEGTKACPLGALCLNEKPSMNVGFTRVAGNILDKSFNWLEGFVSGVDEDLVPEMENDSEYKEGMRVGKLARKRFLESRSDSRTNEGSEL